MITVAEVQWDKLPIPVVQAFVTAFTAEEVFASLRFLRCYQQTATGITTEWTAYLHGCLLPDGWDNDDGCFRELRDAAGDYLDAEPHSWKP